MLLIQHLPLTISHLIGVLLFRTPVFLSYDELKVSRRNDWVALSASLMQRPQHRRETGSCCRCERPRGWIISPQAAPAWAAGLGNADAWNVLELETGEADWGEAEGSWLCRQGPGCGSGM